MKTKRKSQPKNILHYLLDEYVLFRRDFMIETSASVEDCAYHLGLGGVQKRGPFNLLKPRNIVPSVERRGEMTHFVIRTQDVSSHATDQTAVVEGSVSSDEHGTTVVEGSVLMQSKVFWFITSRLASLFVIYWLLNKLNIISVGSVNFFLGIFVFISVFNWLVMYADRNSLLRHIQTCIQNAERDTELKAGQAEASIAEYDGDAAIRQDSKKA